MPLSCDCTVTVARGAGGSKRTASYACIAQLPNFHHEFGGIILMDELRRKNLRRARRALGSGLLLNAQMNARTLGKRKRLKRLERPLTENRIDMPDHKTIIAYMVA